MLVEQRISDTSLGNPFSSTRRFVVAIRRSGRYFSFLFSSEAPTHLNSDRGGKLREDGWLISAILREISHLGGSARTGRRSVVAYIIRQEGEWPERPGVTPSPIFRKVLFPNDLYTKYR